MSTLEGQVAVITGASRGIGRAVALAMAAEGARVVANARNAGELETLASAAPADAVVPVAGDISLQDTSRRLADTALQRFDRCDILVNAAAINGPVGEIETVDPEAFDQAMRINVTGTFLACRAVLPQMKKRRAGRILNVSSGLAERVLPGQAAYSATKAAVLQFTRVLAAETSGFGILANAVHPGIVRTEMFTTLKALEGGGVRRAIAARMADLEETGSVIEPAQSAAFFVWLASGCRRSGEFIRIDDPEVVAEMAAARA